MVLSLTVVRSPNSEMGDDGRNGSDSDGDRSWQALFQGPAHDAGVFYNQIHGEINALRSRVDQKLQDIIVGGKHDIDSLNQQVRALKSTASSEASDGKQLPAVEMVAGKTLRRAGQQGKIVNSTSPRTPDDSSFGDLRVSASAATEPATNLTRTLDMRQRFHRANYSPRESMMNRSSFSGQESGMSISECDEEDFDDDDEDSGVVYNPRQQSSRRRTLRPQRQKLNANSPLYSPNDAVAAARHATQDDAVTNARYGRASPPRRRFFPEDPVRRRFTGEDGMSAMSTNYSSPAVSPQQSREYRLEAVSESSAYGPSQSTPLRHGSAAEGSVYGQGFPPVPQSQSSFSRDDEHQHREQVPPSDSMSGVSEDLRYELPLPLGRTASDVKRSIIYRPAERQPAYMPPSPSARDAPEVNRDRAAVPDPVPSAVAQSRSFKYPSSAAASVSASTAASDQFGPVVPSRSGALSTKSRVSGMSTPPVTRGRSSSNRSSSRSRPNGTPYPSEVKLPRKGTTGADTRSEANMSTRSRISGLSEPFEAPLSTKSRESESQCFSDPRSDDLLLASLEFLEESRRLSSGQQRRKLALEQYAREWKSANSVMGKESEFSGAKSGVISEVSNAMSGTSELSYGSGLKPDEVDLLKASLAYLQCNNRLPTSPPKRMMPPRHPMSGESSGDSRERRQPPTRPRRGGKEQWRQSPLYQQQPQHDNPSLPDHLRPMATRNSGSVERQPTATKAQTNSTKSRRSSHDHSENQEENDVDHYFDWGDQSVSHQSYASKSIAAKSANLLSIASSSVTEHLEMKNEHHSNGKDLLAILEKEVGGPGGVVKVEKVQNHSITDPYGDKGRYTGLLVKGKPYGHGSMHYDDGRSYTGEWKNGRWHGKGRTLFVNGDFYVGEYAKDQRHGLGRYEWSDGRVYDGQFRRDRREGKGTYSWPDGAIYTGDFKNGHRHGQGCYKFKEGSVYTGEFRNGKYHGVGECVWADGRCYRGEWREGHAHGYGVEMRPDGTIRHDGEWRRDRPIRNGKIKEEKLKEKKKVKGCKMPEGKRKHRQRPTPGGSPHHPAGSLSPNKPRHVTRIDP